MNREHLEQFLELASLFPENKRNRFLSHLAGKMSQEGGNVRLGLFQLASVLELDDSLAGDPGFSSAAIEGLNQRAQILKDRFETGEVHHIEELGTYKPAFDFISLPSISGISEQAAGIERRAFLKLLPYILKKLPSAVQDELLFNPGEVPSNLLEKGALQAGKEFNAILALCGNNQAQLFSRVCKWADVHDGCEFSYKEQLNSRILVTVLSALVFHRESLSPQTLFAFESHPLCKFFLLPLLSLRYGQDYATIKEWKRWYETHYFKEHELNKLCEAVIKEPWAFSQVIHGVYQKKPAPASRPMDKVNDSTVSKDIVKDVAAGILSMDSPVEVLASSLENFSTVEAEDEDSKWFETTTPREPGILASALRIFTGHVLPFMMENVILVFAPAFIFCGLVLLSFYLWEQAAWIRYGLSPLLVFSVARGLSKMGCWLSTKEENVSHAPKVLQFFALCLLPIGLLFAALAPGDTSLPGVSGAVWGVILSAALFFGWLKIFSRTSQLMNVSPSFLIRAIIPASLFLLLPLSNISAFFSLPGGGSLLPEAFGLWAGTAWLYYFLLHKGEKDWDGFEFFVMLSLFIALPLTAFVVLLLRLNSLPPTLFFAPWLSFFPVFIQSGFLRAKRGDSNPFVFWAAISISALIWSGAEPVSRTAGIVAIAVLAVMQGALSQNNVYIQGSVFLFLFSWFSVLGFHSIPLYLTGWFCAFGILAMAVVRERLKYSPVSRCVETMFFPVSSVLMFVCIGLQWWFLWPGWNMGLALAFSSGILFKVSRRLSHSMGLHLSVFSVLAGELFLASFQKGTFLAPSVFYLWLATLFLWIFWSNGADRKEIIRSNRSSILWLFIAIVPLFQLVFLYKGLLGMGVHHCSLLMGILIALSAGYSRSRVIHWCGYFMCIPAIIGVCLPFGAGAVLLGLSVFFFVMPLLSRKAPWVCCSEGPDLLFGKAVFPAVCYRVSELNGANDMLGYWFSLVVFLVSSCLGFTMESSIVLSGASMVSIFTIALISHLKSLKTGSVLAYILMPVFFFMLLKLWTPVLVIQMAASVALSFVFARLLSYGALMNSSVSVLFYEGLYYFELLLGFAALLFPVCLLSSSPWWLMGIALAVVVNFDQWRLRKQEHSFILVVALLYGAIHLLSGVPVFSLNLFHLCALPAAVFSLVFVAVSSLLVSKIRSFELLQVERMCILLFFHSLFCLALATSQHQFLQASLFLLSALALARLLSQIWYYILVIAMIAGVMIFTLSPVSGLISAITFVLILLLGSGQMVVWKPHFFQPCVFLPVGAKQILPLNQTLQVSFTLFSWAGIIYLFFRTMGWSEPFSLLMVISAMLLLQEREKQGEVGWSPLFLAVLCGMVFLGQGVASVIPSESIFVALKFSHFSSLFIFLGLVFYSTFVKSLKRSLSPSLYTGTGITIFLLIFVGYFAEQGLNVIIWQRLLFSGLLAAVVGFYFRMVYKKIPEMSLYALFAAASSVSVFCIVLLVAHRWFHLNASPQLAHLIAILPGLLFYCRTELRAVLKKKTSPAAEASAALFSVYLLLYFYQNLFRVVFFPGLELGFEQYVLNSVPAFVAAVLLLRLHYFGISVGLCGIGALMITPLMSLSMIHLFHVSQSMVWVYFITLLCHLVMLILLTSHGATLRKLSRFSGLTFDKWKYLKPLIMVAFFATVHLALAVLFFSPVLLTTAGSMVAGLGIFSLISGRKTIPVFVASLGIAELFSGLSLLLLGAGNGLGVILLPVVFLSIFTLLDRIICNFLRITQGLLFCWKLFFLLLSVLLPLWIPVPGNLIYIEVLVAMGIFLSGTCPGNSRSVIFLLKRLSVPLYYSPALLWFICSNHGELSGIPRLFLFIASLYFAAGWAREYLQEKTAVLKEKARIYQVFVTEVISSRFTHGFLLLTATVLLLLCSYFLWLEPRVEPIGMILGVYIVFCGLWLHRARCFDSPVAVIAFEAIFFALYSFLERMAESGVLRISPELLQLYAPVAGAMILAGMEPLLRVSAKAANLVRYSLFSVPLLTVSYAWEYGIHGDTLGMVCLSYSIIFLIKTLGRKERLSMAYCILSVNGWILFTLMHYGFNYPALMVIGPACSLLFFVENFRSDTSSEVSFAIRLVSVLLLLGVVYAEMLLKYPELPLYHLGFLTLSFLLVAGAAFLRVRIFALAGLSGIFLELVTLFVLLISGQNMASMKIILGLGMTVGGGALLGGYVLYRAHETRIRYWGEKAKQRFLSWD